MTAPISSENLPESVSLARQSLKPFLRLTYGSALIGMAMMAQASWWVLAAGLFFLLAIVGALILMTKFPAARARVIDYLLASILLVCCTFFLLGAVGQLVFFDQMNAYADCIRGALTITDMDQCNNQLQNTALQSFIGG